jgi:uncharacterized RDD family membrane protein YckC
MNTDFREAMSERTDEELIKIVTVGRNDYQALAIEAAEEEVKNRGIDTTTIEQVKIDLTTKIEEQKQFDEKKVSASIRLINFIVDTIAFCIVTIILSFILGLFIGPTDSGLITIAVYLTLAVGFFGYYIFMETKYQKTIGKFITKTTVVTRGGAKPEVGDIVRRTFCRLIPFDRVSFLFAQSGFHDRFSDTTIIKDEN